MAAASVDDLAAADESEWQPWSGSLAAPPLDDAKQGRSQALVLEVNNRHRNFLLNALLVLPPPRTFLFPCICYSNKECAQCDMLDRSLNLSSRM